MFVIHNKPVIKSYRAVLISHSRRNTDSDIQKILDLQQDFFLQFLSFSKEILSFSKEICTVCN
jgi:hypothetical protein